MNIKMLPFVFALALAAPSVAATSVAANLATPTSLGSFAAGTYAISASGLVDLVGAVGSGFTLRPDGVPDTGVTFSGYGYFNPSGSPLDIPNGSILGPGGGGINLGALMGTLTATPSGPGDYFTIGYGTTLTLVTAGNIYAQVNDTYYPNNGGAFLVDVRPLTGSVPEPASWALMIAGFGMVGAALRRRAAVATA